jgi:hypothetical protein
MEYQIQAEKGARTKGEEALIKSIVSVGNVSNFSPSKPSGNYKKHLFLTISNFEFYIHGCFMILS